MAKIALRAYNHEIEGMIEAGQVDEAVAHCQHILKSYPMHIETYRLLGKAFLENRRYADAADIFIRVLQAVPDDFVANVGMSIIRDDENKLDDAIWHMERAFEVQPSNPAIQGELRRLYGRRDGMEPPKIRLSRDALANMYAQGELYNQAISEIRSVLAEDANRPDLQVMLARAHFRAGQKVEAAEMAIQLLKKYPYCVDALRILLEVLPGTTRADDTQAYRQRLRSLDPYTAFVTGSTFEVDKVSDAAVTLERLEYSPSASSRSAAGDWAASLGVKNNQNGGVEQPPEWLSAALSGDGGKNEGGPSAGAGSQPEPAKAEVPDWLRAAGWQEATGEAKEGPMDLTGAASEAEGITPAEIPDWLRSMAPPEATAADNTAPEAAAAIAGGIPEWLNDIKPEDSGGQPPASEPVTPAAPAEIPEWLNDIKPGDSGGQPPASEPETPDAPAEIPDWLNEIKSGGAGKAAPAEDPIPPADRTEGAAAASGIPDWLNDIKAKGASDEPPVDRPSVSQPPVNGSPADEPAAPAEIPDWLRDLKPEPPHEDAQPENSPAAEPGIVESAGEPPAADTPTADTPMEPAHEANLPDWLKEMEPQKPAEPAPEPGNSETPPPASAIPGSRRLSIEDDAMGWLESLAAKQGANPDELLTRPEDRPADAPASFKDMREEIQLPAEAPVQAPVQADEPAPEPVTPAAAETPFDAPAEAPAEPVKEPPVEPAGEMPAASGITRMQPPPTSPLVEPQTTPPGGEDDTLAAWLSGLDKGAPQPDTTPGTADAAASSETPDLPDWLKDLEKPATPAEAKPAETPVPSAQEWMKATQDHPEPEEMGTWGHDEPLPSEEPPARTTPAEWIPLEKPAGTTGPSAAVAPASQAETAPTPPARTDAGRAPSADKERDNELLQAAQSALRDGRLNDAVHEYGKLIKRGRMLEEVIHDLREANYRFPVDIIVWQTLGDAYMRANRLQDALDAYTEAEKLLR